MLCPFANVHSLHTLRGRKATEEQWVKATVYGESKTDIDVEFTRQRVLRVSYLWGVIFVCVTVIVGQNQKTLQIGGAQGWGTSPQ